MELDDEGIVNCAEMSDGRCAETVDVLYEAFSGFNYFFFLAPCAEKGRQRDSAVRLIYLVELVTASRVLFGPQIAESDPVDAPFSTKCHLKSQ